jgi:hypothetical protein
VRAPSIQRQPAEIAADIVEVLRVDDSDIERMAGVLRTMKPALLELRHLKKLSAYKADVERERRRLEKLRAKYLWIGPGFSRPLDEAVTILARLRQLRGPRAAQSNPYIAPCLYMAAEMIRRHSRDKRLDKERLGMVAGYIYEAATGIRGKTFRRACQEFVAEKRTSLGKK